MLPFKANLDDENTDGQLPGEDSNIEKADYSESIENEDPDLVVRGWKPLKLGELFDTVHETLDKFFPPRR